MLNIVERCQCPGGTAPPTGEEMSLHTGALVFTSCFETQLLVLVCSRYIFSKSKQEIAGWTRRHSCTELK